MSGRESADPEVPNARAQWAELEDADGSADENDDNDHKDYEKQENALQPAVSSLHMSCWADCRCT